MNFTRKKLVGIFLPLITSSFSVIQVNPSLAATLVNWDTIGWQDGILNQELQSGNNTIKIDFRLGSEAQFVNFVGRMTPSVSGLVNGSNPDSGENIDQSLHLQLDASQVGAFAEYPGLYSATMNVNFSESDRLFSDVSFMLYDIDISYMWQDRVSIIGFSSNSEIAPEFTIQSTDYVEQVDNYTLDGIKNSSNDADNSNVLVYFSSSISGFQLIFTDGDDIESSLNPSSHGIGIGDIYYTEASKDVPEPSSTLGFLVLGIMGLYSRLKMRCLQLVGWGVGRQNELVVD